MYDEIAINIAKTDADAPIAIEKVSFSSKTGKKLNAKIYINPPKAPPKKYVLINCL